MGMMGHELLCALSFRFGMLTTLGTGRSLIHDVTAS